MGGRYVALLRRRGVGRLVVIDVFAKLGVPVLSLALLLAVVDEHGSYATGGLVLTVHAMSVALCTPVGGRLADRWGARRTLTGYLAGHAVAYVLLLVLLDAPVPVLLAVAGLLGATAPPNGAVIRTAWPRLTDVETLPAAYALDNAVNELMFILGPVLVSGLLLVMSAREIVVVAGLVMVGSTAALVTGGGIEGAPVAERGRGVLRHRPTLVLLALTGFGTFSYGCLRIGTVASATVFGAQSASGVLMGLASVGALAGGLGYGSRGWAMGPRGQLVLLSLAEAVCMAACALAPGFVALGAAITVAGLLSAPRDTLQPALLAELVPPGSRTEAFAWLNSMMWAGYGVGTAIAGGLTGPHDGGAAAFATAAVVAVAAATLAGNVRAFREFPQAAG